MSHLVVDKQTKREGNTNSEEQYPSPLVNAPNLAKPPTQATGKKRGRQFPAANIELMQPHADRYLALKKVGKNYSTNDSHAAHLTAIAAAHGSGYVWGMGPGTQEEVRVGAKRRRCTQHSLWHRHETFKATSALEARAIDDQLHRYARSCD